jgi:uncharacterized membrane protein YphA (DoxX/SURF4 family)
MKANKIVYWTTTSLVALMMLFSAWSYFTNDQLKQAFTHLGFPGYFRIELAIAKFTGAILLLAPVKARIKEWVYAGFTIVFTSAIIAHVSSGDRASVYVMPFIFLAVLIISYVSYLKLETSTTKHISQTHLAQA